MRACHSRVRVSYSFVGRKEMGLFDKVACSELETDVDIHRSARRKKRRQHDMTRHKVTGIVLYEETFDVFTVCAGPWPKNETTVG